MNIQNVHLAYENKFILRNINLDIPQWDFAFLIGASGSGKTSFIKMLIGELPPKKGVILWKDALNIYKLSRKALLKYRRTLGIVFQDFKLLPRKTIEENVAFAMEVCGYTDIQIRERVPQVLSQVGLLSKRNAFIETLSGGETQRTSIARALIHDPDVIIGDEPTGNLDPKNAAEIIELLLDLHKAGKTIIIATHDDRLVNSLKKRVIAFDGEGVFSDTENWNYCL